VHIREDEVTLEEMRQTRWEERALRHEENEASTSSCLLFPCHSKAAGSAFRWPKKEAMDGAEREQQMGLRGKRRPKRMKQPKERKWRTALRRSLSRCSGDLEEVEAFFRFPRK
jgi:transcription initiation factor TFIIIB Brf1 subunit/transcription initiation factor TFIIB